MSRVREREGKWGTKDVVLVFDSSSCLFGCIFLHSQGNHMCIYSNQREREGQDCFI